MMKKILIFLVTASMLFFTLTSCGGGSGESSSSPGENASVFDQENYAAAEYVSAAQAYAKARTKGEALIANTLGEEWRDHAWTPEEIVALLGEEEAAAFVAELNKINSNEIKPALDKMVANGNTINGLEEQIEGLLNLAPGVYYNADSARFTGVELAIAGTILLGITAAFAAEAATVTGLIDKQTTGDVYKDIENAASTWLDSAEEGLKAFVVSAGESLAWAGASAWAQLNKLKKLALSIDVVSTGKTIRDGARDMLGIKDCTKLNKANSLTDFLAAMRAETDTSAVYIGRSDADGTFHNISEGEWAFVVFEDGLARGAACIDVKDDVTEATISMQPAEYAHDTVLDDDSDGYTEAQGDCDDTDPLVHPTAVEVCNDDIDNDCNGVADCQDDACEFDAACQETSSSSSISPSSSSSSSMSSIGSDSLSVNVSIASYTKTFTPVFTAFTYGNVNDGPAIYPSILSLNTTLENYDPSNMDIILIMFSEQLGGPGTYTVSTDEFFEGGPATVTFSTETITHEDNGWPVTFTSYGGSVTFESYGVNVGDRLRGSFSVNVLGRQDKCEDAGCTTTYDNNIYGTISGTFDGILRSPSYYMSPDFGSAVTFSPIR